jgi:16S rRNA G527 N7-methylase RsmG
MINAIQDMKEKAGPSYEDLKKSLQEWNTTYKTTKSGEITEVADRKVMDYIDKKLAEYGRYTKKR